MGQDVALSWQDLVPIYKCCSKGLWKMWLCVGWVPDNTEWEGRFRGGYDGVELAEAVSTSYHRCPLSSYQ